MLVIAERINASRKPIQKAILERKGLLVRKETRRQLDAGAGYIDANAGISPDREPDDLVWLVKNIQREAPEALISLDTTNPAALRAALPVLTNSPAMINSISGEKGRHEEILPLVREFGTRVIALTIGHDGALPETVDDRLRAADFLAGLLAKESIPLERVYFDPIVYSVATNQQAGKVALETVRALREKFPAAHVTCGLSNISFGLPRRSLLNTTFLAMMLSAGIDSAIIDPVEPKMAAGLIAAKALLGEDDFCVNYIAAERAGKLEEVKEQ